VYEASAEHDYPFGERIKQIVLLSGTILPIWELALRVMPLDLHTERVFA
jgi:hypothetical protein